MTDHIATESIAELAPEPPPRSAWRWLHENLFSTPASGVMSLVSIAIVIAAVRGFLGFLMDPLRRWDAVTFNMRLLMVQAYPVGQFARVWASVGIVVVLLAASLAVWRVGGRTTPRRLGTVASGIGGFVLLAGVVGPWGVTARLAWLVIGAALLVGGYVLRLGDRAKVESIPVLGVVLGFVVLVLVALWTIRLPFPEKVDGEQTKILEPIAASTRIPWTVLAVVGIVVYLLFRALRDRLPERVAKNVLVGLWVATYPVVVVVVLRDPHINYGDVFSSYLPYAVALVVVGAAVLSFTSSPRAGELGRVLSGLLLVVGLASIAFPMLWFLRFSLLTLAVLSLAGPAFGGQGAGRWRYLGIWAGTVLLLAFFTALIGTESTVETPGAFFIGGLGLTIIIAVSAIVASFPLGVVLALGRTSSLPLFRIMSTTYIELVRGVPLITWLLVAFVMLPVALPDGVSIDGVMRAIGAMTFFSAAYLAENVRGGLQSIPRGQYEAARALGMSTVQMTVFIVLPQALRAVIPALVGQVIAIFKDTSLVTIVGLFDFLHIARFVIPGQSQPFNFLGTFREPLLFAAVVYWMFTFTFSRISLRLEKKLGVGER